jgi:hypothetical protein
MRAKNKGFVEKLILVIEVKNHRSLACCSFRNVDFVSGLLIKVVALSVDGASWRADPLASNLVLLVTG